MYFLGRGQFKFHVVVKSDCWNIICENLQIYPTNFEIIFTIFNCKFQKFLTNFQIPKLHIVSLLIFILLILKL